MIRLLGLRENMKIKKTAERVKLASFTLPLPPLLKEWKTKEWNNGMFGTPLPPARSEKFGRF